MGYKNILITLDGSELAERAIDAARMAAVPGAKVHLLSVVEDSTVTSLPVLSAMNASFAVQYIRDAPVHDTLTSQEVETRVAYLNTVKDALKAEGYAVTAQVRHGHVVETVLDTSRNFDLLVMATHGRSGLGKLVLGSVTEAVLHRISTPMLIAPARAPWLAHKDQGGGFRCILISLDGSVESEAILPAVEDLLSAHPGKVVLLQVAPYVEFKPLELSTDEFALLNSNAEREVRQYLEAIGQRFEVLGATPIVETNFNAPGAEIRFSAEHYHADLIAMATHGWTGVNMLLHGSITEDVLHHANCPMLIGPSAPSLTDTNSKKE